MKNETTKTTLNVKDNTVSIMKVKGIDYISLTDLARYKNPNNPGDVINKWMSTKDSFDFYSLWEELFNPNFNFAESREIKIKEAANNAFTMSPSQWKKRTNSVGIIPSSGRYSKGTYAHPDIALEFASWIDTRFKLYLIKEFERLKENEAYNNKITWSIRRELAKTNYKIHTNSIKENLIPTLDTKQKQYAYANEADVLNIALFGMTAKEWQENNLDKKGNIRDTANILQLIILSNLEVLNSEMIHDGISINERIKRLNEVALKQMNLLLEDNKSLQQKYPLLDTNIKKDK